MDITAKDFLKSAILPPLENGDAMYSKKECIKFMEEYAAIKSKEKDERIKKLELDLFKYDRFYATKKVKG